MNTIDITIIINAHTEGTLVHASCLSIRKSMLFAEKEGITCEVLAVIDKGSKETLDYFKETGFDWIIPHYVDYGDLGSSRNYGASQAKGKYIAFLDGDDLWSENWLVEAFKFLRKRK